MGIFTRFLSIPLKSVDDSSTNASAIVAATVAPPAARKNVRRKLTPALAPSYRLEANLEKCDCEAASFSFYPSFCGIALRSDTRRELAASGLDIVYRTVSTVVRSSDLFQTPSISGRCYFAQFARDAPCVLKGQLLSARRRRSAPFVGVTCLLAGHNVASKRHGHERACVRARKTTRFFYAKKITTQRERHGDIVHFTREYSRNCQLVNVTRPYSTRDRIEEMKGECERERERRREERTVETATPQLTAVGCELLGERYVATPHSR